MPTLAVIAHDGKKADLVAWATFNRETLAGSVCSPRVTRLGSCRTRSGSPWSGC